MDDLMMAAIPECDGSSYPERMPRWLAVILTLVLFAAMMLAVRAGLVAVLPSVLAPVDRTIGEAGTLVILLLIAVAALVFGVWPRDPSVRMKPLSRRR